MAAFIAKTQRAQRGGVAVPGGFAQQRKGALDVHRRSDAAVIAIGEIVQPRRVVPRQAGETGKGLLRVARRPAQLAKIVHSQLQQRGMISALGRGAQRAEPLLPQLRGLQQLRRQENDLLLPADRVCPLLVYLVHIPLTPRLFFRYQHSTFPARWQRPARLRRTRKERCGTLRTVL